MESIGFSRVFLGMFRETRVRVSLVFKFTKSLSGFSFASERRSPDMFMFKETCVGQYRSNALGVWFSEPEV